MADKVTIGLTVDGQRISDLILSKGWFNNEMTIAKFAMSYAIKADIKKGEVHSKSTKWNRGSIDEDGGIKNTLFELYDEREEPYRLAEYLIDEGLKLIEQKLKQDPNVDLTTLLLE